MASPPLSSLLQSTLAVPSFCDNMIKSFMLWKTNIPCYDPNNKLKDSCALVNTKKVNKKTIKMGICMMKSKVTILAFAFTAFIFCCGFNLEAKSKTRFGFSFGHQRATTVPVYVAPQPVYVYSAYPEYRPLPYPAPVYYRAPVVYETPVYVQPQPRSSVGFSFFFR